jgi:hypothetical protein
MNILWSKDRIAEQHLEGDCRDVEKLKIEIHGVEQISEDESKIRLMRVHHVESVSDGTLRIFVDLSKENVT